MKKVNAENVIVREGVSPLESVSLRDRAFSPEDVQTWRKQLVQGVVRAVALVGPLAAVAGSYYDYRRGVLWTLPLYWGACGILLLVTFLRRTPYAAQAGVIMVLLYGMAVLDFLGDGRSGSGRVFLVILPVMAGLLYGFKGSVRALVLALVTMVGFAWAYSTGRLTVAQEASSSDPVGWLSNTFVLMMLGILGTVSLNHLVPHLSAALVQSRELTQELEEHRAMLEEQVAERTADLARRSTQLEMAAWVAREAAAIRDVEQLLEETVRLISDRFGFYHTGIFLLDDAKEYAVLRAASSDGGQRMLARRHRLKVGEVGIVGYVTGRGEPRVALDVGEDAVFFNNPDLPDTRSEMALPLQAHGEIIGALDVQSREPEAFSEEDVAVLQTLADQVALAISNTRLFQRAQDGLKAARRAYSDLSREAWLELLRARPSSGQRYDPHGILAADSQCREEVAVAVRGGQTVRSQDESSAVLATPIKVRGEVIGVVDARKPKGEGEWTPEQIALLETLTEQLGVALESARLYQDAQRRAARERLIGDVTARMRETLDLETVLKTAAHEVRQALDLPEVVVRLATKPTNGGLTSVRGSESVRGSVSGASEPGGDGAEKRDAGSSAEGDPQAGGSYA
jgi:GAF domain-containing protein